VEQGEAVWGGFTEGIASIIPPHPGAAVLLLRCSEKSEAASTVAQFGYLLAGFLPDLDRRRSDSRIWSETEDYAASTDRRMQIRVTADDFMETSLDEHSYSQLR
jgi:hypothetical protein